MLGVRNNPSLVARYIHSLTLVDATTCACCAPQLSPSHTAAIDVACSHNRKRRWKSSNRRNTSGTLHRFPLSHCGQPSHSSQPPPVGSLIRAGIVCAVAQCGQEATQEAHETVGRRGGGRREGRGGGEFGQAQWQASERRHETKQAGSEVRCGVLVQRRASTGNVDMRNVCEHWPILLLRASQVPTQTNYAAPPHVRPLSLRHITAAMLQVNHIDDNKLDNKVRNFAAASQHGGCCSDFVCQACRRGCGGLAA